MSFSLLPCRNGAGSSAGQGWAQPQFETGEESVPCPPRGAGELERGQEGRGHAGRMQSPLLVLTPEPRLLSTPEARQGAAFVGRRREVPSHPSR